MTAPVTKAKVEAALKAEADKLSAKHRGVHIFKPIWPIEAPGSNWHTTYLARGSSIDLDEMADALQRVKIKHPTVKW